MIQMFSQVIKEANPQLLKYLLQNPKVTSQEITSIAGNTGTPMDVLKIDQAFIRDMQGSPESLQIVKTVLLLAQALNMEVIAEGIEKLGRAIDRVG